MVCHSQTYVGIFILSQLFEIGITLDALAQKNIIQLIMLVFFQCAMVSRTHPLSLDRATGIADTSPTLAQTTYAAFLPSQLSEAIVDTSVDTQTTEKRVRAFAIVIAAIVSSRWIPISFDRSPELTACPFVWSDWVEYVGDVDLRLAIIQRVRMGSFQVARG